MAQVYSEGKSFIFTFFSKVVGLDVVDDNGNLVGRVYDILAVTTEVYPKAFELLINQGFFNPRYAYISWFSIAEINQQVRLKINGKNLKFTKLKELKAEISLRRDILDQQVVDTFNRRVVRVNDLHLLKVGTDLMVAHIDIGMRGLMRRLNFDKFIDFVISIFVRESPYLKKENFISWKNVQILSVNPASHSLKVGVPAHQFSNIHPADLQEIIKDLDPKEKLTLFKALDLETKSKVLADIDIETQKFLIHGMDIQELAKIIATMPSDEATDFLFQLSKETVNQLLNIIETSRAKKLSTLLGYASDTAGGLMTAEYIAVPETTLVSDVLKKVIESNLTSEAIYYIYIVDEKNHFVGRTTLKRVLAANSNEPVNKTALPKSAVVHLDDNVKEVAFLMEKYRLFALPVIDNERVLQGIITIDDILEQLLALVWRRWRHKR